MSDALRFDGVRLSLGGRPVLRGVDLTVSRGEVVGLVGANGAGKTTLLRVATRALRPDAGRVLVDGAACDRMSRRDLARAIAVVPQETQIPFAFRVGEMVLMGRSPHLPLLGFEGDSDVELARQAMQRVGIAALADRTLFQLSGGERQLVMIARALAQAPSVLLLDEATAFLDLRHRVDVLRIVREFSAAGGAALVVSHDLNLAARHCDRIALLCAGRIHAVGPPVRVLTVDNLDETFGVRTRIGVGPDGAPVVVVDGDAAAPRDPAARGMRPPGVSPEARVDEES